MYQEISSNHEHQHSQNSGSHETSLERSLGGKKTKAIRKGKSIEMKSESADGDALIRSQLTKEQKKQIQKEKNRVAAQLSRDRQKKYLQDLEVKIVELEKQLQSKLCSRCRATLAQGSTAEEDADIVDSILPPVLDPQNEELSFLDEVPEVEQLPLVRDNSRTDADWGNIGKYFCIFLVVLAVSLLSNSVEPNQMGLAQRQVARVLVTDNQVCEKPKERVDVRRSNITSPSTLQQIKAQSWPFIQGSKQPIEECKNTFWHTYLQGAQKQQNLPYDWNLVNCNTPNLIHISSVYDNVNPQQGKWTFLITNPTVTHSHIADTGKYYVDEVSYLSGVYQMIAEKVVLKKVMGKNCLA